MTDGALCRGPWQLRQCIACNNATDTELHLHTYAVGVADKAAREGSPHNVLHSSSNHALHPATVLHYTSPTLQVQCEATKNLFQCGAFVP